MSNVILDLADTKNIKLKEKDVIKWEITIKKGSTGIYCLEVNSIINGKKHTSLLEFN